MASFAGLVPGAWKVTFASGESSVDTWHWGPGRHSVRGGALEVFYWHPGREEVRLLTLHPDIPGVGRGVGEGTIRFDGVTADGVFDLHQPRGRRKLGLHWSFDGPDHYRDTLLEETGPEGLVPMNGWERFRVARPDEAPPRPAEGALPLPAHLTPFRALLGGTWESTGDTAEGLDSPTRTTFRSVPDYVHAQVHAEGEGDAPTLLLDAYFFEHVGTGALRCLALSHRGGVYEGDVTVLDGGALELDLLGHEPDRVVRLAVRLDLGPDGALHQRVWSVEGTERTPVSELHHRRLAAPNH